MSDDSRVSGLLVGRCPDGVPDVGFDAKRVLAARQRGDDR